jgi:hypothetical protein
LLPPHDWRASKLIATGSARINRFIGLVFFLQTYEKMVLGSAFLVLGLLNLTQEPRPQNSELYKTKHPAVAGCFVANT